MWKMQSKKFEFFAEKVVVSIFFRIFALPFKRWIFHRTNGAKYVERFVCLQPLEKMLKS